MRFVLLSLFVFCLFCGYGMDAREVISRMQKVYKATTEYDYHCTYTLFKGHKSREVEDSYGGYVYRNKHNYYQKIGPSEFVYGSDFFLQINHSEKALSLDLAQQNVAINVDLETALKECVELKLEEQDDFYQVVLRIKTTSQLPYSLVKLKIGKTNFYLRQIDLYYSEVANFSKDPSLPDRRQPHLRIAFNELNTKPKKKDGVFLLETYLSKDNNMLQPAGNCKGYDLIDKRLN